LKGFDRSYLAVETIMNARAAYPQSGLKERPRRAADCVDESQAPPIRAIRDERADVMAHPDFTFVLGNGRRLEGVGPRGLAALALFLVARVLAIGIAGAIIASRGADILRLL
jgi:hypothetical protein